jgi:hypothetical protein
VLTHTRPWPPPGAGAFVAASVAAPVAGAGLAAAAPGDAEVFGLNKLPSENLPRDGEGAGLATTAVSAFLRLRFSAGKAEVAGAVAAGEAATVAFVPTSVVAGAGLAAVGLADAEVFGLNKLPSENLPRDGEGAGLAATSVCAFLRLRFSAGEAEVAGAVAAGEIAAAASAFLCARRFPGDGDAAGDSVVEGDAASSAGDAVAAAFLCARCFAGEGDTSGTALGASN